MPVYVCWYTRSVNMSTSRVGGFYIVHRFTPRVVAPGQSDFDKQVSHSMWRVYFNKTLSVVWLRTHKTYLERLYPLTKREIAACTVSNHISSATVALFVCRAARLSSWRRQECRPISRFPADKSRWVTGMTQPYPTITGSSWNSGSIKAPWTSQAAVSLSADPYK